MDIQELCSPPPLWCGGGVVLRIYIYVHIYIYMSICVYLLICNICLYIYVY